MSKPRTLPEVIRGRLDRLGPLLDALDGDHSEDVQNELDRLLTLADQSTATVHYLLSQARDVATGVVVRNGEYEQRLPGGKSATWPRWMRERD